MNNIGMSYDLETTGLLNQNPKIVQFGALFIDLGTNEVLEKVNFFKKCDVGDFLLQKHGQHFQDRVNEEGLDDEEFKKAIKQIILKYEPSAFITSNGREFDNRILKQYLKADYMMLLLKQHDTRIYEQHILGCDKFGKTKSGRKFSTSLSACCQRHNIRFNEDESHEAVYDATKSFELFLSQKKIINKRNLEDLTEELD